MAQFGDYEHDLILRQTVQAAARHAYGVTGSDQRGFDPGAVLDILAPRQILALHRLANRATLNRDGSVDYGRRVGPRLPGSRARDLKEALHSILAIQAATASAAPQRQLTAGEQHLDSGLRSLFAEEQVRSFADGNGIGRRRSSGLVQDRTTESRVFAPAAKAMVDDLAKATGSSRADVLNRLLSTPADQRFDLAASMMVGRGEGMAQDHRDHARNRMAEAMNQQFTGLGKTAKRYEGIGRRWRAQNRLVKGLVYLGVGAAVISQPWLIPVLVAGRFLHPIQRLQRVAQEIGASARGSRSVGQARKILDHEHETAARLAGGRQVAFVQTPGQTPAPASGQAPAPASDRGQPPAGREAQASQQVHVPGVGADGTDVTAPPRDGTQGPGQAVPGQTAPGQTAPGQAVPGQAVPGQGARVPMPAEALQHPGQVAPGQAVPGQAVPGQDGRVPMPAEALQPVRPPVTAPAPQQWNRESAGADQGPPLLAGFATRAPERAEAVPAGVAPGQDGGTDPARSGPAEQAPSGSAEQAQNGPAEQVASAPVEEAQSAPAGQARSGAGEAATGAEERPYRAAHRAEDLRPAATTDSQPRRAEPATTGEYEPRRAEPRSGEYEPRRAEPGSGEYEPRRAEPATAEYEPRRAEPATTEYQPRRAEPATTEYQPRRAEPVTGEYEPRRAEPVAAADGGAGQGDRDAGGRPDGGQGGSNEQAGPFRWPGALDVGDGRSEADQQLWTATQAASAGVAGARPGTRAAAEATTSAGRSGSGQGRDTTRTETER